VAAAAGLLGVRSMVRYYICELYCYFKGELGFCIADDLFEWPPSLS